MTCELWVVRTLRIVLLSILLLALPVWGRAVGQERTPPPVPPIEFTVQSGHTAEIQGLEYASDGKFFVSAGKDSTIKLWSPEGTLIRTIRTGFWVNYLALSHDGRVVHKFPDIPVKEGYVSAVALSDDNRHVAIGTTKGLVLYRFENGVEARLTAEGDTTEVDSVLFARNGPLIGGLADGKLRFWTEEGKLVRTIPAHDYAIQTLALSPDGKTLATAGMPYLFADIVAKVKPVTKLWDLQGNPLGQFPSHYTHCLRFTPDGEDLVSSGRLDNAVNIYRRSGERLRTITVGSAEHRSSNLVALAPDGRTLITADDDVDPPVF